MRVRVEHRPAAITRESITRAPHHVDVAGALRDAFFEDADPLVEQREDAALEDFLRRCAGAARWPSSAARRARMPLRFRIVMARAIALLVAIEPLAGLLPQPPGGVQRRVRLVVSRVRRITMRVRAMHVDAHVDARHVEHGENAHRHAELFEHRVHAARRRAFERQQQRLARVPFHHAIADEAVADSGEHRRLANAPWRAPWRCGSPSSERLLAAHHFEQRHHVRWREEVQADDVLRPLHRCRDFIDIQRRGVGGEQGAGFGDRIEFAKHPLLEIHALEHGLDDDVAGGEIAVVRRSR